MAGMPGLAKAWAAEGKPLRVHFLGWYGLVKLCYYLQMNLKGKV